MQSEFILPQFLLSLGFLRASESVHDIGAAIRDLKHD